MLMFLVTETASTDIYTLSLHDALPICAGGLPPIAVETCPAFAPASRDVTIAAAAPAAATTSARRAGHTQSRGTHPDDRPDAFAVSRAKNGFSHGSRRPHSRQYS